MVGLGHVHRLSLSGGASKEKGPQEDGNSDSPEDETTVVEPEQGNVLSHIISQLRPGADLSRVVLPTFILEPRSMLERITNFMQHPETLLPMPTVDDPIHRFVSVVKFYLSGWHIKPPGVKKPLNPILGEYYTCWWDYSDNTRGYYIAEQTSHHPPKSSYFYMAPEQQIRIDGTLKPRSRFLGNSAASLMEGIAVLTLLNKGASGEKYILTQPNMYARGILFGKMKYELGDHSVVRCPEHGFVADIEFKTKGYFGGTYNAIGGVIKNEKTQQVLFELSGMWTGEMFIKDVTTGQRELLFDASKAKPTPPNVRPSSELDERESTRLWAKCVAALKERNHEAATEEKSRIEEMQRAEAARRHESKLDFKPKFFRPVRAGPGESEEGFENLDWILDAKIDGQTVDEQVKQILSIVPILPSVDQAYICDLPRESTLQQKQAQPQPQQQIQSPSPQASQKPVHSQAKPENAAHSGADLINFGTSDGAMDAAPIVAAQHHISLQQEVASHGQGVIAMSQLTVTDADELNPVALQQPPQPSIQQRDVNGPADVQPHTITPKEPIVQSVPDHQAPPQQELPARHFEQASAIACQEHRPPPVPTDTGADVFEDASEDIQKR